MTIITCVYVCHTYLPDTPTTTYLTFAFALPPTYHLPTHLVLWMGDGGGLVSIQLPTYLAFVLCIYYCIIVWPQCVCDGILFVTVCVPTCLPATFASACGWCSPLLLFCRCVFCGYDFPCCRPAPCCLLPLAPAPAFLPMGRAAGRFLPFFIQFCLPAADIVVAGDW